MNSFIKSKAISILMRFSSILPDDIYLKIRYFIEMGYPLNLENPKLYNEKLQWLKLYDQKQIYSDLVDKYKVKAIVAKKIGEKYIIPTIGVWDNIDQINFNNLPDKFVLKTTHGGGSTGVFICKDKNTINKDFLKKKFNKLLKRSNEYIYFKEWPYKNASRKIIIEKLIGNSKSALIDYKFYCFNGVPKVVAVATGRYSDLRFDYFDMNFNHLEFEQGGKNSSNPIDRPKGFDQMIEIAAKLSENLPHVRVDLYNDNGIIYFGELTFFDSSGFAKFYPPEWDQIFGSWIELPTKVTEKRH